MEQQQLIQQLRQQLEQARQRESFVVKEGDIVYIHPKESPTENFSKIEVGFDCTQFFMGREFKDFMGAQINSRNKELFAAFDTQNSPKFKIGDRVKIMCSVGGWQVATDKNKDRPVIYNNVELVRCELVNKAQEEQAPARAQVQEEQQQADDLPF